MTANCHSLENFLIPEQSRVIAAAIFIRGSAEMLVVVVGGYHEMWPLSAAAAQLPSVRARLNSLNSLNSRVPRFGPQYYIN